MSLLDANIDLIRVENQLKRTLNTLREAKPSDWSTDTIKTLYPRLTRMMEDLNDLEFEVVNMTGLVHNKIVETDT